MGGSVGSEDGDIGFQIAPMVDVVFVLMLFFMASAGWKLTEKELRIRLPSTAVPTIDHIPPPTVIMIDISADGQIVANNQSFGTPADKGLNSLRDWLKSTQSFGGEDLVIIRPNSQTRHERIMDVLNACSAAGVENLKFL